MQPQITHQMIALLLERLKALFRLDCALGLVSFPFVSANVDPKLEVFFDSYHLDLYHINRPLSMVFSSPSRLRCQTMQRIVCWQMSHLLQAKDFPLDLEDSVR